ncbi:hemerythrin domain-containing protein [Pollutimonas harenae]|uniref:Hemerythrin domain-containing protein n=1 Tax=Pollutimonas harenae TaxID=657015 RepID=A0A853GZS8_9BURK|nr:hemerythrin domain-containing protein [Pollutimonas harenae]NYT86226.1 hemerythrin domain-containing protein [Pollutimonas harenae]TEA71257.1 hemerythrin domain-containing protein [Pollutimonas harenae]
MEIDRFKKQHVEILQGIATLRKLAHAGIEVNAREIARQVQALGSVITLHLAIEDRILYPSLQKGTDTGLAEMGKVYQEDMKGIASSFIAFARKWSVAKVVAEQAEAFRAEANTVLKVLHARMQRENTEFYPAIEAV